MITLAYFSKKMKIKYLYVFSFLFAVLIFNSKIVYSQWELLSVPNGAGGSTVSLGSHLISDYGPYDMVSGDTGITWKVIDNYNQEIRVLYTYRSYVYRAGGGISRSSDSGYTWKNIGNDSLYIVIFSLNSIDSIILIGCIGGVIRITPEGKILPGGYDDSSGMPFISFALMGKTIFAGSRDSGVYRSTDYGFSWKNMLSGTMAKHDDQWRVVTLGTNIFTLPTQVEFGFLSRDSGNTWEKISVPPPQGYSDIGYQSIFASGSKIFVSWEGYGGGVMMSQDTAKTWVQVGNSLNASGPVFIYGDYLFEAGAEFGRLPLSYIGLESVTNSSLHSFKFYPLSNPITNSADFQFSPLQEPEALELFDLLGRQLLRREVSAGAASLHVDMQQYPAGVYLARLGNTSQSFVKVR